MMRSGSSRPRLIRCEQKTLTRKRTEEMFATRRFLLQSIVIVVALATSSPGRAQPIVATVYGEAITTLDIEQRTKFTEMATNKVPSRQQVIDELTKEKLKVREAKKHGLNLSNEEVDLVYENLARRLRNTPERLTQNLAGAGSSADTVKHRIRADLADKYMRARYPRGDFWIPHDRVPGR
jgi:peptidyl-prolyl cis-trans isomerase SurA